MGTVRALNKLTSDERREAIIQAVKTVFAKKGFYGTTTKELAAAAGISEALLFKHFPNKEALYDSVIESCFDDPGFAEIVSNRFLNLQPSSETLIMIVHFMISHYVSQGNRTGNVMDRLAVQSMMADGEFLRRTINKVADTWIHKFGECLEAARKAGDLHDSPVRTDLRFWFTQHIGFSLMLHRDLPEKPALDYNVSKDTIIEQATWYALLGIGIKEEVIRKSYNVKALGR
jgi:AcrR family transcriptional regulator